MHGSQSNKLQNSSILLLNPNAAPTWDGAEPAEVMRLAALVERHGHRVRAIDFNVNRLDFGILADDLEACAPDWVGLWATTSTALEAYRIGRFIAAARPAPRLLYAGPHTTALPDEAFELGDADAVILGEGSHALQELLRGTPWRTVPHVVIRDGDSVVRTAGCVASPHIDELAPPPIHLFDRSAYTCVAQTIGEGNEPSLTLLTSVLTSLSCPVCCGPANKFAVRQFRSLDKVLTDLRCIRAAGIRSVRFADDEFFADVTRLRDICQAIANDRANVRWLAQGSVKAVLAAQAELLDVAKSGCAAVCLRVETNEETLALARDAAMLLARHGIQPIFIVRGFQPGDSIESPLALARFADEVRERGLAGTRPARVLGTFTIASPAKEDDSLRAAGRVLARSWPEYLTDRLTYVPDTFLDDVPRLIEARSPPTIRVLLESQADRVAGWIASNLYLSRDAAERHGSIPVLLKAAADLCAHIDGTRSVAQLASVPGCPAIGSVCTLICLLSMLGIVRGSGQSDQSWPATLHGGGVPTETHHVVPTVPVGKAFFCSRPWTGFEVGEEDGVVRMCCWAQEGYGNVNEDTIATIWNQAPIQRMRRLMAEGRWAEICRPECPYIAGWMRDEDPTTTVGLGFRANLERSRAEIAERKLVLQSFPRYWKVTHSTRCNLDCIMCYQDRRSTRTLPKTFYQDLAAYYPVMQELLLLGGEPLATKEIRRIIADFPHGAYPDARFALITNGTVFDAGTMELVAQAAISWIVISLDAATPHTYAHIRRPGVFAKTLAGVRAWKSLSERLGFPLVLSFTVMRDNLHELSQFTELAQSLSVDCQFSLVSGNKADQNQFDRLLLRGEIERALRRLDDQGLSASMPIARASLLTVLGVTT